MATANTVEDAREADGHDSDWRDSAQPPMRAATRGASRAAETVNGMPTTDRKMRKSSPEGGTPPLRYPPGIRAPTPKILQLRAKRPKRAVRCWELAVRRPR